MSADNKSRSCCGKTYDQNFPPISAVKQRNVRLQFQPKDKSTSGADLSKAEGSEKAADSPSDYSRGEGQKPVSKAYKDNWNAIYGKTKKKKR